MIDSDRTTRKPRRPLVSRPEFRTQAEAEMQADDLNVSRPIAGYRWIAYADGTGWSVRAVEREQ